MGAQEEHMTALIWAAFHGQLEEVKKLVTKLSDVNLVDEVSFLLVLRVGCMACNRLTVRH